MLLAEVLLVSRLLGLVAGEQRLDVQVDSSVHSIEIRRDGERLGRLTPPAKNVPLVTSVNFGKELAPHDLTVIAFNADGEELGRDTQAINVARPPAELGVLLERDDANKLTASIRWAHFAHATPRQVIVKLDGKTISKTRAGSTVALGAIKQDATLHVLGVDVVFPDGVRSRKEVVFGGGFSEQLPAELTPIAVRVRTPASDKGPVSCFSTAGNGLPAATVERGHGAAHFIINGRRGTGRRLDLPDHRANGGNNALFTLGRNDIMIVDPVAQEIDRVGGHTFLFDSKTMDGGVGTRRLLANPKPPVGTAQIADAVGAAALRALRGGERRVVVVVLGDTPANDHSMHNPAVVRRYLQRIGVPLRVWSLTGPRPDLAETWGEVRDVSNDAGLLSATEDLRDDLESQRVAWLPVQPLDAFRIIASENCAYAPLAGSGYSVATRSVPAASAR